MFDKLLSSVPSVSSLAALFAFSLAGCAAEPAQPIEVGDQHQPEVGDPHRADGFGGLPAPVTIDQSSNGKAVDVVAGQAVIVTLPANGTTGYEWGLSSDAAPLGQPDVHYEPAGDAPGAGGSTTFLWADTKSLAPGHYSIALAYRRSWEPGAADSFSAEIDVVR